MLNTARLSSPLTRRGGSTPSPGTTNLRGPERQSQVPGARSWERGFERVRACAHDESPRERILVLQELPDRLPLECRIAQPVSRIFLRNGSHRGSLLRFSRPGSTFIQSSPRSRLA